MVCSKYVKLHKKFKKEPFITQAFEKSIKSHGTPYKIAPKYLEIKNIKPIHLLRDLFIGRERVGVR